MAKKDIENDSAKLAKLAADSHILVYGNDGSLSAEDEETSNIINQTIVATKDKFGVKTGGKPVNYFNEVNIGSIFSEVTSRNKEKNKTNDNRKFKDYMSNNEQIDAASLLLSDQGRLIQFENYRTIYNHITECAQALDVYKDNIMSPDDFTKLIFNIDYEDDDSNVCEKVEADLKNIVERYEIEEKADKILEDTLKLGEEYVAVLALDDEIESLLKKGETPNGILNEELLRTLDSKVISTNILSESIQLSKDEEDSLKLLFEESETEKKDDKDKVEIDDKFLKEFIAYSVNNNIVLGSTSELLTERFEYEKSDSESKSFKLSDIPGTTIKKKREKKKDDDGKPLFINGSTLKLLDPSRTLELKIDDITYGYYYVEDIGNPITASSYLGLSSGREARQGTGVNMGLNNNVPGTTKYNPTSSVASSFKISEEKLKIISKLFVDKIASKIDKKWIRENKKFKDFIYELLRQDYIIKKGIKMTYFTPDEVVKFEAPAIYRKIVFAAKLYLSMMTNDILIKLGRAHDKRVFYVNVGLDANYEQAINKTIEDIKRREYRMDNLNDFNSILNLNPGRWDDYFIPTVNGDRPLEIDTLAGMDTDLNSEFLTFLKNTMMSGIGVPTNLIDNMNDISFARSLSAQNANFVRSVIKYQKLLTKPFTKLIQKLYKNEFKYVNDKENKDAIVDIEKITVSFPSPAALNMSNLSEQIQIVSTNADFIASQLVILKPDGSNDETKLKLQREIIKDLMPAINWDKYEDLKEKIELESKKDKVANPAPEIPGMIPTTDPYGQAF